MQEVYRILLTYPAIIYFTAREEDSPYNFLQLFENSATQGRMISEAMSNASGVFRNYGSEPFH